MIVFYIIKTKKNVMGNVILFSEIVSERVILFISITLEKCVMNAGLG